MKQDITRTQFVRKFGLIGSEPYKKFLMKLNTELADAVHPSARVTNLGLLSSWTDSGGNIHGILEGHVIFVGEQGELGGEIVWLKNLRTFRGKIWSSLDRTSDHQLAEKARQSFRQGNYRRARDFLDGIQDIAGCPRSTVLLSRMINRKVSEF